MKMNYVLKSNHRSQKSTLSRTSKILGCLVILLAIVYVIFPALLPHIFIFLAKPFWNLEQNVHTQGGASIEELRREYALIENESAKNNLLEKENADLKSLLGRSELEHPLLATVIKKPPFSAYDTFILDIGVAEKVKIGNRVYALGSIPIGEIVQVVGGTSKVLLYSSYGQKFNVTIGTSSVSTLATGKGGGYFEASLPRDTKIGEGDTVRIPSISHSFVGTVEAIASDPSEPFSKVLFRQPFNLYEMNWVLVDIEKVFARVIASSTPQSQNAN
jgi:cell shape-determining protein MreC